MLICKNSYKISRKIKIFKPIVHYAHNNCKQSVLDKYNIIIAAKKKNSKLIVYENNAFQNLQHFQLLN